MGNTPSLRSAIPGDDDVMAQQVLHFKNQVGSIPTQATEAPQFITPERGFDVMTFFKRMRGLRPEQIAQLTQAQIKKIPAPLIGSLSKEQQEAFTLAHVAVFSLNQLKQLKNINPAIISQVDLKLIQQMPEDFQNFYLNKISIEGIAAIKKTATLCKIKGDPNQQPGICRQILQIERLLNNPGEFETSQSRYAPPHSRPLLRYNGYDGGRRKKSKKSKHRLAKKTRRSRK